MITFRSITPALAGFALLAQVAATPALAGPKIEQWTAPNGAHVLYVESHALPLVDIQVDFSAGSAYEPADKAGLAGLTRSLLEAGAGELDEQQIADRIADIGAQVGGSTDNDRSGLSIRSLSSPAERDAAVELAASLLAQPSFPADILERERTRAIAGLREALTKPATLAARRFNEALYPGHPYGTSVTPESLEAITRDDLIDFHRQHFGPQRASLAIVEIGRAHV